ncbi:MAG: transglutaminase domain-containing protein, partial [Acidobacteriota bacterium]
MIPAHHERPSRRRATLGAIGFGAATLLAASLTASPATSPTEEAPPPVAGDALNATIGESYVRQWLRGEPDPVLKTALEARRGDRGPAAVASPSPEQALGDAIDDLRRLAGHPGTQADALRAAVDAARAADLLVEARFADIRRGVEAAGLGAEIAARLDAAEARHRQRSGEWRAAARDAARRLDGAPLKSTVDAVKANLVDALGLAAVEEIRELRADALPYRTAALAPRAPSAAPEIEAAYQRADDVQPEPADFASSPAAALDVLILRQAEDLGYDYVRIYEFVRHQIDTEVYAGSMKGAAGTLRSGRGNDVDQASLLVALLRASRAAARYVHGVIELDLDAAGQPWGLGGPDADADAIL